MRINCGEEREKKKVAQVLCHMPLILIGSPVYLARHGVPTTLDELAHHECVSVATLNRARSRWVFVKRGGRRRVEFTPRCRLIVMDELDAVGEAAKVGLGLTLSAADNIQQELREGSLVRVMAGYEIFSNDQAETEIVMQYLSRKHMPPKVRVLVDFLLDRLRERAEPAGVAAWAGPRTPKPVR